MDWWGFEGRLEERRALQLELVKRRLAPVVYEDFNVGVTPCTISVRARDTRVILRRDGYHEQRVQIGKSTNAMMLGNIIAGGVVGMVVDASSGAAVRISTDPCWVELTPLPEPAPGEWVRSSTPPAPEEHIAENEGWVREGQAAPAAPEREKLKSTRAPAAAASSATGG